jgi:hypothetical protein
VVLFKSASPDETGVGEEIMGDDVQAGRGGGGGKEDMQART